MNKTAIALVVMLLALPASGLAQIHPLPDGGQPTDKPPDPNQKFGGLGDNGGRPGAVGQYLIGKVKLEHAALPWDPIPVSVKCDGKVRYTTHADRAGTFLIGSPNGAATPSSKEEAKQFTAQLVGCSVTASWPGFESSSLAVAKRNLQDTPNVGTIVLNPGEAGNGFASATTASAPSSAMKLFEKARNEWIENKRDNAEKDLEKAVEVYPQFAEAWYQLGKIQEGAKSETASTSFSKALAADPKFALPYEHMALRAAQEKHWQDAVNITAKGLESLPQGTIEIWFYNALGEYQTGKLDVAQASAEKSLAMDPLHVEANTEQLLAIILRAKGDTAGALGHLESCQTYFPPGAALELIKEQIAEMKKAGGNPQ